MNLEITGKLIEKGATQQVSEKFKKRDFVVEISDVVNGNTYTNPAKFQLEQNKCDLIDRFNIGDNVKVSFNIKGNSYTDKRDGQTKYISNLSAWRIESVTVGQSTATQQQAPQQAQTFTPTQSTGNDSDLPF